METPLLGTNKVPTGFSLTPSYGVAVKVLAKRRGHNNYSEIVRDLIDREMRTEEGRHWETDIAAVAAREGVYPPNVTP